MSEHGSVRANQLMAANETGGGLCGSCCKVEISDEQKALLDAKYNKAEASLKKVISYTNQNQIFTGKLLLAMSTATLMVIFGLPLFSSNLKHIVFGHHICKLSATGFYLNKGTEDLPRFMFVAHGNERNCTAGVWKERRSLVNYELKR
eukprot:s1638_g8.t1